MKSFLFVYWVWTSQSIYVAKTKCWPLWPSSAIKAIWKLLILKEFLIETFLYLCSDSEFLVLQYFKGLKLNIGLLCLYLLQRPNLISLFLLPYQFGLAAISGFRDHSDITLLRTHRNQLVNIYLIGNFPIIYDVVGFFVIWVSWEVNEVADTC